MSWFPGINRRPGIVTADWLMTRGNTISNGSEYVTKIQAAKNILLTPPADAKASELVAEITRLGQALRGGAAPPTLFANPGQPAAEGELSEAARPLAGSVSSESGFIPGNPADAVAMVPSAERAAAADSARAAAERAAAADSARAAAQPQPEEGAPAAAAQPEAGEESRGALNSSVFGVRRGGRRHQTPKRRRSGRNGLSKKRRHTGK